MRARSLGALALILCASAAVADTEAQLCVQGGACVVSEVVQVVPAPAERTFVLTSADRSNVTVGTIPANVARVATNEFGHVKLRLESRAKDRWPAPAVITVRSTTGQEWLVERQAREVNGVITLRALPGEYDVFVRADRMRTRKQHLGIGREPAIKLKLEPLPSITGRVIGTETNKPVFGALVSTDDSPKTVALTDAEGTFAFDADPEAWPAVVRVASSGLGTRTVPVPPARASVNLLDIPLSRGGIIAVSVSKPSSVSAVDVEIYPRRDKNRVPTLIARRELGGESSSAEFDDVDPGPYVVVVRGEAKTEQFAIDTDVDAKDKRLVEIALRPMRMIIRNVRAGEAFAGARVRLSHFDGSWVAELEADQKGGVDVPIWQAGQYEAWVIGGTMTTPFPARRRFEPQDSIEWTIDVPTREVRGVVHDAESGRPVPKANVFLAVERGPVATVHADEEGRFVFTAPLSGRHTVGAAADGYLPSSPPIRYTLTDSDGDRDVVLVLDRSNENTIEVRDAAGAPVEGAAVLDFDGTVLTGKRRTDAEGTVRVPLPRNGRRRVFVIARDGAMGVTTLASGGEARIPVRIAAATTTLVVRTETTDHQPIPDVWLLVRWNGVMLPIELLQTLAEMHGSVPISDRDGRAVLRNMPPGFYEIWPLGSPEEMRAVMMGGGSDAPVKLQARAGENEATLTFTPSKP